MMLLMALRSSSYRTATGTAVITAFLLVLVFGSPVYVDWVNNHTSADNAGGYFLRELAWPAWAFDGDLPVRDLVAAALKSVLLIAFTAGFVGMMTGSQLSGARGSVSAGLVGWAAYIFAGAFAGLLTAFLATDPSLLTAFTWASGGAGYGLFVGWIVGLASLVARRP